VALTKTHFPTWSYDLETYYLACLLHDIGTAEKFLSTTKLSFEFKGAIVARDLILSLGGVEDQADSVCDAIVRHQDIFVTG
jgi:cyanamide hydratase